MTALTLSRIFDSTIVMSCGASSCAVDIQKPHGRSRKNLSEVQSQVQHLARLFGTLRHGKANGEHAEEARPHGALAGHAMVRFKNRAPPW